MDYLEGGHKWWIPDGVWEAMKGGLQRSISVAAKIQALERQTFPAAPYGSCCGFNFLDD